MRRSDVCHCCRKRAGRTDQAGRADGATVRAGHRSGSGGVGSLVVSRFAIHWRSSADHRRRMRVPLPGPAAPPGMTPQRRGTPMDSYTITITPNDDSGNSTTLTVDTAAGQARITSVHMHAPDGLTGGQMPSVDVGLLLQAVTGPTPTPAAITATPTPVAEATPQPAPADADEPATTAPTATPQSVTGDLTSQPSAAAPAKRTSRRPAA